MLLGFYKGDGKVFPISLCSKRTIILYNKVLKNL